MLYAHWAKVAFEVSTSLSMFVPIPGTKARFLFKKDIELPSPSKTDELTVNFASKQDIVNVQHLR